MPGRIILVNGASSSGKSTLSQALQAMLDEPFWHYSIDHFRTGVLPWSRIAQGNFAWPALRPAYFDGFHRCLPALAGAGNDLIVDHIIETKAWLADLLRLLAPIDVYFVGLHCPLPELERRERERGDRRIGEARTGLRIDPRVLHLRPRARLDPARRGQCGCPALGVASTHASGRLCQDVGHPPCILITRSTRCTFASTISPVRRSACCSRSTCATCTSCRRPRACTRSTSPRCAARHHVLDRLVRTRAVGCGALKEIDPAHGEVKSMRTATSQRRNGVGRAMLEHIVAVARARPYARLSLETGSMEAFAPARALYESFGFAYCGRSRTMARPEQRVHDPRARRMRLT